MNVYGNISKVEVHGIVKRARVVALNDVVLQL